MFIYLLEYFGPLKYLWLHLSSCSLSCCRALIVTLHLGGFTALGLEAEPVGELPLGPSSDDPPAYLGPRIVGAVEGVAPLLLVSGEDPQVAPDAIRCAPTCVGDEATASVFKHIIILRVPEHSPASRGRAGLQSCLRAVHGGAPPARPRTNHHRPCLAPTRGD